MGRPINKRYFGNGAGHQIKVRAYPTGGAEGDGIIVRQKGSKRFIVTVGGVTSLCTLVNKANGTLAAGEMTITVADNSAANHIVTKITAKRATLSDGTTSAWSFAAAVVGDDQIGEATDLAFTTQPANLSKLTADTNFVAFTVVATANPSETISYQWQSSIDGGVTFNNVASGYTGGTTASLTIAAASGKNGYKYRCIISSPTGGSLTSNVATLTVS